MAKRMTSNKKARGSCNYRPRHVSKPERHATIVTDFDFACAVAGMLLVLAFGACMVHWAVM